MCIIIITSGATCANQTDAPATRPITCKQTTFQPAAQPLSLLRVVLSPFLPHCSILIKLCGWGDLPDTVSWFQVSETTAKKC